MRKSPCVWQTKRIISFMRAIHTLKKPGYFGPRLYSPVQKRNCDGIKFVLFRNRIKTFPDGRAKLGRFPSASVNERSNHDRFFTVPNLHAGLLESSGGARNSPTEGLNLPIGGLGNRRENMESQLQ